MVPVDAVSRVGQGEAQHHLVMALVAGADRGRALALGDGVVGRVGATGAA